MSPKQESYYWRLWGQVRKAKPDTDRKALHTELGLPNSHAEFTQKDFDRWIGGCQAITQPGNMDAQIRQEAMGVTRLRVSTGHLLDALGEQEAYAVAIVRRMNSGGRIGQPWSEERAYVRDTDGKKVEFDYAHTIEGDPARPSLLLEDLDEAELYKVVVALKKACKRRWPLKADLLGALAEALNRPDLDRKKAHTAICAALGTTAVPDPEKAVYETIVIMLGALKRVLSEPR